MQPTSTQTGASARDYNFNIFGGGFTRLNYYLLFGDKLPGDWREGYKSECVEHGLVRAANRACVRYHCPQWLVDWARVPFVLSQTENTRKEARESREQT